MVEKKCKKDEILNPKTGRCVKKNGKIGKLLLVQSTKHKHENISVVKVEAHVSQTCDFRKTLERMFPHMSQPVVQTFHVLFKKYIVALVKKLSLLHHTKTITRLHTKDILLLNTLCFDVKTPPMRQTRSALYPQILSCLCREVKTILPNIVDIEKTAVETIDTLLAASFQKTRNSQIEKFVGLFYYDTEHIPNNAIFQKLFLNALGSQMFKG